MKINDSTLELVQGDITTQNVDAIVNAANSGLAGGGGVDGAIHRAGGPIIMQQCRALGRCPAGEARLTEGGKLPARHVIHAVGPIYNNGISGEPELLAAAYRSSLELAAREGFQSIAFPSLSTGAYRYPVTLAAKNAINEVARFLREENSSLALVRFVLFDGKTHDAYDAALRSVKVSL